MKFKRSMLLIICLCVFITVSPGFAAVEWDIQKTVKLKDSLRDLAVSRSGKWIYILTGAGEILIYSSLGIHRETIVVGNQVDRIKEGPTDDVLLISNRKDNSVQVLSLEFIQKINTIGAPIRGDVNAPVTVAVFSEFQ